MKNKILATIIVLIIFSISILIYFVTNLIQDEISKVNTIEPISTYNNPVIPKGFKKVETEDASWKLENGIPKGWNDGLVIEDEIGNQFVWIPVNLEDEEYNKISEESDRYYKKDSMQINIKEEVQILKYGGFYLSRYEAGITDDMQKNIKEFSAVTNDIEGIPVSKQGQIPWNYISWSKAKKDSEKMYQDSKSVESNLMTSKQLGSLCYWLNKKGHSFENSKDWGNFSNINFKFTGYYSIDHGKTYMYGENKLKAQYNMILSTGATERNKSNNIYDLAGNVMEYIDVVENYTKNEKILNYYAIGGYYDNISEYYIMQAYGKSSKQGFRVVLYNK